MTPDQARGILMGLACGESLEPPVEFAEVELRMPRAMHGLY